MPIWLQIYEGYRFYRSLFEDAVVGDKPALLAWKQDHWIMQRPFDWSDHVNDFWDEALTSTILTNFCIHL